MQPGVTTAQKLRKPKGIQPVNKSKPTYPKGDLRRMLMVLGAIQETGGATLVQIVARTCLDKKTVSDLIAKSQEQAGVKIVKAGANYSITELGQVFKSSGLKLALQGVLNAPIIEPSKAKVGNQNMPDMEMCNSTVCSISSNCERNWDSHQHIPDRDVNVQKFIPQKDIGGVGYVNGKASECKWYMPVSKEPVVIVRYQTASGERTREFHQHESVT